MARKKAVPVEEQEANMEALGLPEVETVGGSGEIPKGSPETPYEAGVFPEGLPEHTGEVTEVSDTGGADPFQGNPADGGEAELPGTPPETDEANKPADEMPEAPPDGESPPGADTFPESPEPTGGTEITEETILPAETPETPAEEAGPAETGGTPPEDPAPPPKSDRPSFFDLDFNDLDRDLTAEERQEWNSIYASYRGRSALTGTIIGVDPHSISVRNQESGRMERQTMYCAIVIPYRVRVVIPATEMWEAGHERPDFVLQNMVGATIDFIIIKVDRESGFAIGSRRLAARSQRYFFAHRPALCREGARLKCRVLSVGPRRCLVECYGHDVNMTQRDLRYTAIPDLRNEYRPGQKLDCVVKGYDPEKEALRISVKETESNPFEGAEFRHPAGSRRQAVIAGKYGGGVFCNLPDGTVCMCNYSYQYEDSDFLVGDTVILLVQRHEREKRQMYGKILSKW